MTAIRTEQPSATGPPARSLALRAVALVLLSGLLGALADAFAPAHAGVTRVAPSRASGEWAQPAAAEEGCLTCHTGIEDMHPGFALSCVDCHGGDPKATTADAAHVASTTRRPSNERVLPKDFDLAHIRFINPMDLRVAGKVCGDCHGDLVQHLMLSLHGTTAGHLSDGFFENGLQKTRDSKYAVFPVDAPKGTDGHTVDGLVQPPKLDPRADQSLLSSHFPDLVRKECMQCHLWSEGRAVRGRVGFDGEYRGGGCAACHVPYRVDGLSESLDPTVDRVEPGHPRVHAIVEAAPTETCTTCHFGDASIGLHFRGLSQLPPGAPGGPEVEGTTDALLHRAFFVDDPAVTPPDVHHASGLHCVDCHTLNGVMGDGRLVSKMEEATEITCQACHGTFTERSTRKTESGTRLRHLFERDGDMWMRSKVTGAEHRIKQAVDVLDVSHRDYNEKAAEAMTGSHASVACYTCHGGWNVNFLGFHFYRNEALSQLDLLTGQRTKGRVTTQEKVFTTWKSFFAGFDERGRIAPYLTGFSTMGTVDGEDGERILDQELPVTKNDLSGLSMIHHQLHSTRPTARSCVECHRASETWGMGSANFRLGRQVGYVADRRGIEVVAFDRETPQASVMISKLVQPDIVELEVAVDPLQGFSKTLFALEANRGLHAIDASDPRQLRRRDFHMSIDPRAMALTPSHLFLADGVAGVKIFDVSKPDELKLLASVPTLEAQDVEVRWPYAYIADGPGGLLVLDVRVPARPTVVGGLETDGDGAVDLDVLFQYSRPTVTESGAPSKRRTPARRVVALLDKSVGLVLVDATEPSHLRFIEPYGEPRSVAARGRNRVRYRKVEVLSHVDIASPQGGTKTVERDLAYVLEEVADRNVNSILRTIDISDPREPKRLGERRLGGRSYDLDVGAWYTPPVLRPLAFIAGEGSLPITDVANSNELVAIGGIASIEDARAFAAEFFPLDKMLDEDGRRLKDVSHPKSRWLLKGEIAQVLDVSGEDLGTVLLYDQESIAPASAARGIFMRADADRNGILTAKEAKTFGGAEFDANEDGRLTLFELSQLPVDTELDEAFTQVEDDDEPDLAQERRESALARILDGVDPFAHERKKDGRLDRREFESALFAALDLNADGALDVHERSRRPNAGDRALRFDFKKEARVRKKRSTFDVRDEEWDALDVDGDGAIQLDPARSFVGSDRRENVPMLEWPTRRLGPLFHASPILRGDQLIERFDAGTKDGRLSKSEMKSRPRLFRQLDVDRSSVIEPDEVNRLERNLGARGVDAVPDDFVTRWDVDGNGTVEASELTPLVRALIARRIR